MSHNTTTVNFAPTPPAKPPQSVRDYVQARCDARRAADRYQRAEHDQLMRKARHAYAAADRAEWRMLDHASAILNADVSLTNPADVLRLLAEGNTL